MLGCGEGEYEFEAIPGALDQALSFNDKQPGKNDQFQIESRVM